MSYKKVKSQKRRQKKTHKRTRHRFKGGAWYNPFSWFATQTYVPQEEKSMVNRIGESITSGIQKVDDTLASASTSISEGATNIVKSTTDLLNKDVSLSTTPITQVPSQPLNTYSTGAVGGKHSRRHKKYTSKSRYLARKGGRGLGLTYYAAPVSDIKIAEPTYLLNYEGGRKRKTYKK